MVVRFMLGVVEAAVFPALVIFISRWFARSERSLANSFVTLSTPVTVLWMSILSSYLVQAFGWRWMFVLEGLPASLWAVGWWALVQDRPSQAPWLAPPEKQAIEARIASEQDSIKPVRSLSLAGRDQAVGAVFFLGFEPLRVRAVAADDHQGSSLGEHRPDRLAVGRSLSSGECRDAGGLDPLGPHA
jgi:MFS family permease